MRFILYSRSNCPLCEQMEVELGEFVANHKIKIERLYIDNKPELVKLYGDKVPVLTLNNETLCEYFLDAERLLSVIENNNP